MRLWYVHTYVRARRKLLPRYYLFAFKMQIIIIIISCERTAVRRRFAGNAAHFICCARCTPDCARTPRHSSETSNASRHHKMTSARAVGSGRSTSCEWKEGGNAVCSALVNCVTVHETAKWDSPH